MPLQILIKRYSNRRLYDTSKGAYVTLSDIAETLREGHDVNIVDAKTGGQMTKTVMLQVLLAEEQTKDQTRLLTNKFLKDIVRLYKSPSESLVALYLEQSIKNFNESNKKLRDNMDREMGQVLDSESDIPNETKI
jgi:polyhydroxyalkanoate synthesis repressor PhaR